MRVEKNMILVTFLQFFFVFMFSQNLFAAFVNIDKAKERITDAPGSTVAGVITIENSEKKDVYVKIYPMEWSYKPPYDGVKDFYPAGTECDNFSEWFQYYPQEVTLGPGERFAVHYKITIPEDLKNPCYLVLFFETSLNGGKNELSGDAKIGLNFYTRIGTLILIEPEGVVDRSISVLSGDVFSDNVKLVFNNDGNAAFIGSVSVFVLDGDGNFVGRTEKKSIYVPPKADNVSISLPLLGEEAMPVGGPYKLIVTFQPEVGSPISEEISVE